MNDVAPPSVYATRLTPPVTALSYEALRSIVAAADFVTLLMASVLGSVAYQSYAKLQFGMGDAIGVGVVAGVLFVLIGRSRGLYRLQAVLSPVQHLNSIGLTLALALLTLLAVFFLLKVGATHSRGAIIGFAVLGMGLVPGERLLVARLSAFCIRRAAISGRRVVTIGEASELSRLAPSDFLRSGLEEIARVALTTNSNAVGLGSGGRAQVARAIKLSRELRASEFVLVIPWSRERMLAEVGDLLRRSPLSVRLFPDHIIRAVVGPQDQRALSPYVAIEIQRAPLTKFERVTKRMLDLGVSLAAVILLSPLLLLVAVAVKLDSQGPVIFRQRRGGFDARQFTILKFRTMTVQEDDGGLVIQARRRDARLTRLGRVLRRSSIDELPQLFNVIRGEMSLVGPRPHATAHDHEYGATISSYALRHHVKPGLTGMAQITGLRGETLRLEEMQKRIDLDLWYVNNWSLALDLKIMARTCLALLRHEAY